MNKNEVFSHYSAILDNMLDNSLFFPYFLQNPSTIDGFDGSCDDPAVPENISMRFGISRACLIDNDYDYVVKFDIETDYKGDSICDREVNTYLAAKDTGLNQYFVEAEYLGTYTHTMNFYKFGDIERNIDNWYDYDRIDFDENFMVHEDEFGELQEITIYLDLYAYPYANHYQYSFFYGEGEETLKSEAKSVPNSPLHKRALQVAMEFIHVYGFEEYERLSDFLSAYHINDLHRGNIGSINDKPVIIDYGGFHDEADPEEEFSDEE